MENTVKNYFGTIMKKYSVFSLLLISCLLFTAYYIVDKFNIASLIYSKAGNYAIPVFFGLVLLAVFFFLYKTTAEGVNFGDLCLWGGLGFNVILNVYLLITGTDLYRTIIAVTLNAFFVVFILIRLAVYGKISGRDSSLYFKTVFKKFPVWFLIGLSALLVYAFYLADRDRLISYATDIFRNDLVVTISTVVLSVVAGLYVLTSLVWKKVNFTDFALIVALVFELFVAVYMLIFGYRDGIATIAVVCLQFILAILFIRYRLVDTSSVSQDNGKCYLRKVFGEYNPLFILLFGFAIGYVSYFIFNYHFAIYEFSSLFTYTAIGCYVLFGLLMVAGLIAVIKGFNKKTGNLADLCLLSGFIASLSSIALYVFTYPLSLLILGALIVSSILLLVLILIRRTRIK